jgi:hypothetical protein
MMTESTPPARAGATGDEERAGDGTCDGDRTRRHGSEGCIDRTVRALS